MSNKNLINRMIRINESLKPVNEEEHSHVVTSDGGEVLFTGSEDACEKYLLDNPDSGKVTECKMK